MEENGPPGSADGHHDDHDEPLRKRRRKYCAYLNNENYDAEVPATVPRSSLYYWLRKERTPLVEHEHHSSEVSSSDEQDNRAESRSSNEDTGNEDSNSVAHDDRTPRVEHEHHSSQVSSSDEQDNRAESRSSNEDTGNEDSNSVAHDENSNFSYSSDANSSETNEFHDSVSETESHSSLGDENPRGNAESEPEEAQDAENVEPTQQHQNNPPGLQSCSAQMFQNLLHQIENDFKIPVNSEILASKAEIILNTLTFSSKYHSSFIELEGLFKLLNTLFRKNVFPSTRYYLDKFFLRNTGFHYYFYCKHCFANFGELDFLVVKVKTCPMCEKESIISDLNQASFFVIVDLPGQIEILLNDPDVVKCELFNPLSVTQREQGVIKDVYDGDCYRNYVNSLNLSDGSRHLSMCFSDDGTPLYSSSNFSIWPIFLSILELPPLLRSKKILLGGLWFGKGHANQEVFLDPFVDHVKNISTTGFDIKVQNEVRNYKAHVVCCCADGPARASIQVIHQFNGYQGCNWCLDTGEILENTINTRVYPVQENPSEERSAAEVFQDGMAVLQMRRQDAHVNGVLGVSPLHRLAPTMDIVNGMIVEFLHLAARGITGQITGAWFGEDGSHVKYYIGCPENVKRMNYLIMHLSGPKELRRAQRLIEDLPHWKAREYENWALYNSLPVIANFHRVKLPGSNFVCKKMPTKYVKHCALYVEAMHIILGTKVTYNSLDRAHSMLIEFVEQVEELYGKKHMTYNMHILRHLCPNVQRWGQPWAISAYSFESMNGMLKKVVHANRGVPLQIMRAMSHKEVINILNATAGTPFTRIFKEEIQRNRVKHFMVVEDATILGKTTQFLPNEAELYICSRPNSGVLDVGSYVECDRLIYKHCCYSSKPTTNSTPLWKTGNSTAALHNGKRIFIRKIIASLQEEKCFIIASRIHSTPSAFMPHGTTHGSAVNDLRLIEGDIFLAELSQLKTVCVRIFFPQDISHIIIDVPNVFNVT